MTCVVAVQSLFPGKRRQRSNIRLISINDIHERNIKIPRTASHREQVIERLREHSKLVAPYVQAAIEAGDQASLLLALRTVAEACGGVSKIDEKAGLKPESVSRALSARRETRDFPV